MANDSSQKSIIGVSVFIAIAGVGLIVASFATDHWIGSHPKMIYNAMAKNGTRSGSAIITFGLFNGYKSIDYLFGPRKYTTKIECDTSENACAYIGKDLLNGLDGLIKEYTNQTNKGDKSMEAFGLFDFRLYVSTLVMLVLSVMMGLFTIGFSIFNVFGRPIETITGRSGLYIWNLFAFIFDVVAIGLYLGLYFSQLSDNILITSDIKAGFSSKDETDLDYSFYFIVGAGGAFLINLLLLVAANKGCSLNYFGKPGEKEMDNGMILY